MAAKRGNPNWQPMFTPDVELLIANLVRDTSKTYGEVAIEILSRGLCDRILSGSTIRSIADRVRPLSTAATALHHQSGEIDNAG